MSESVNICFGKMDINKKLISNRGSKLAQEEEFLGKYFVIYLQNPFDGKTNPKGLINLGTSENALMHKEIEERFNAEDGFKFRSKDHIHYCDFSGNSKFKTSSAKFLQRWFSDGNSIDLSEVFVMNGVTACLELFALACCDPGDVIITPTPVYGRIFDDFSQRANVVVQALDLLPKGPNENGEHFDLCSETLERRILDLQKEGKNVRGFVLVNPQNPLGVVYSQETTMKLLKVCAKYKIHYLSDEIYALSMFDENEKFSSVLSMNDIPDPERTHFTWGVSKDFSLAGLRCGLFHTKNQQVKKLANQLSIFQSVASIVQDNLAVLFDDTVWCKNFIETNQLRLRRNFELVRCKLNSMDIEVMNSKAGLFAWFDLGNYLEKRTKEDEIKLFKELLTAGVYIVPGSIMHCKVPGWFRVIFAQSVEILSEGLNRLVEVLEKKKLSSH